MKHRIKLFITTLVLAVVSVNIHAQKYPKLIIPGDYPDPTVLKDGNDYYMTHSPFYYKPGFLIWHSTDLVHWTPLCRALSDWKGSAMAPDLVKCNGRYYIYFPAAGTNWVIWAKKITGPWSSPIDLKCKGIDPGHLITPDGERYLFLSEGNMIKLTHDGLATEGTLQKVYGGWTYPAKWETECVCLESPKMTYHDGYYYLTSAQGGTAGPATSHMTISARSVSPMGPWENSPYNPIIHTYNEKERWWSKGHGSIVEGPDGGWWIVYHAYEKGYHTLGRQTLIEPIEWTADGWFKPRTILNEKSYLEEEPQPLSYDFSGLMWTTWKGNRKMLLMTATDKNYEAKVDVSLDKNNTAGMLLYYSEKAFVGVVSDGHVFTIYKNAKDSVQIQNPFGNKFVIRIANRGNNVTIYASKDGNKWLDIAGDAMSILPGALSVKDMNHNKLMGFYALRVALKTTGEIASTFSNFTYRNAIPKDKDLGAYLMVYHQDEDHDLHFAISRDGYTFKALKVGEPVILGDTIAEQHGIRDPHIFRGPDGAFYLVMTDLNINAQKEGWRDTKWERDGEAYGWGNNRSIILMKSWDLLTWSRTNLRLDSLSPSLAEIGCAWAPETTFDAVSNRLMIYFTMRYGNKPHYMHYMYVNDDFTEAEMLPVEFYRSPDGETVAGDGDISILPARFFDSSVPDNQLAYVLMYANNEGNGGIRMAVSDRVNSGYRFSPRWIDFEPKVCEAPNVWKRNGENKWVLMYDIFSIKPHNFGFVETEDFNTFNYLGHFNEGKMKLIGTSNPPKHGAVVSLTSEEADRLEKYYR